MLDIGSGEGFGSAILAGTAASVQGIDIDEQTVEHAWNYSSPNLAFDVGSRARPRASRTTPSTPW